MIYNGIALPINQDLILLLISLDISTVFSSLVVSKPARPSWLKNKPFIPCITKLEYDPYFYLIVYKKFSRNPSSKLSHNKNWYSMAIKNLCILYSLVYQSAPHLGNPNLMLSPGNDNGENRRSLIRKNSGFTDWSFRITVGLNL